MNPFAVILRSACALTSLALLSLLAPASTASAQTTPPTLTTLATFNSANITAGVVQGADGNFYGTSSSGGL